MVSSFKFTKMKKNLHTSLLLIFLLFQLNANAQSSKDTIAHWDFNSSTDNIIRDISGSHPATIIQNDGLDFVDSPLDKALHFRGNKIRIEVPHADGLSLENNFTIKLIVKFNGDFTSFGTILFKGTRGIVPNIIN